MSIPQIVTAVSGVLTSPGIGGPVQTLATYAANELTTIEVPQLDEYINAWFAGMVDHRSLRRLAKLRGVDLAPFNINVTRYAMRNDDGVVDLNEGFFGGSTKPWEKVLRNRTYLPSIDEAGLLLRRQLITDRTYNFMVGRQVDSNPALVEAWKATTYEIPGPQDLIRFAVREAFSPNLIEIFGYNKETPTQLLPWMEKQGYGGSTGLQIPTGGTDGENQPRRGAATWFDLWWWSHWELPSLTQGYEMLHRLYPTSNHGPSPGVTPETEFAPDKLELLQKAQDIPEYWRKRLQAISYKPIDKTDGERMYEYGMIDDAKMYHILRAHGHNDADSKQLLLLSQRRKQHNLGIDPSKESISYIERYYKLGVLEDSDVRRILRLQGFAYDDVTRFLEKLKLEQKGEVIESNKKTLEQMYYRGIYSFDQIRQELLRYGLNQETTDKWLLSWKFNHDNKYKGASAKQNLTAFTNAVINEAVLVSRLFNLGYDSASINIMVANAKAVQQQKYVAGLAKQAKQLAQQAKANQKAAAQAAAKKAAQAKQDAKIVTNKANKRLRDFIKASSDANIKGWYKDKLISLWEVYYRLYVKGYTIKDAEKWVEHNFKDTTTQERKDGSAKASKQFRAEGNYLE